MFKIYSAIVLCFMFTGCISMVSNSLEPDPNFKFTTKSNRAKLYACLDFPSAFSSGGLELKVNEQLVGSLNNGGCYEVNLSPGNHTIELNIDIATPVNPEEPGNFHVTASRHFQIEATAGMFYFMACESDGNGLSGFTAKCSHENDVKGRDLVSRLGTKKASAQVESLIANPNQQFAAIPVAQSKSAKAKSNAAPERLVLMPLRIPEEDKNLQGAMETALVEGLQQTYTVFSGQRVAQKAHEVFMQESKDTAHSECDETRCMQNIAGAFQSELIAIATVSKQDGTYFLALSIQNIFDNKAIYSKSTPCENCNGAQVVEALKVLSSEIVN
jgi:hypothetical protein